MTPGMIEALVGRLRDAARETGDPRFLDAVHAIEGLDRDRADAEREIDDTWDVVGTRGDRRHLTLPEQIASLMREVDESHADRRELLESRRVIDGIERVISGSQSYKDLVDAVEAKLGLARRGLG